VSNWYPAKYSIAWYERKRIPSFAMWTFSPKHGNRYPKTPRCFGITDSLEKAEKELGYVLSEFGLTKEDCFFDESVLISQVRSLINGRKTSALNTRQK
jgi:hypothetical protein